MFNQQVRIIMSAGLLCLAVLTACAPAASPATDAAPAQENTAGAETATETATDAATAEITATEAMTTAPEGGTAAAAAADAAAATAAITGTEDAAAAGGVETNVTPAEDTQTVTSTVTESESETTEGAPMQTEAGAGATQEETVEAVPPSAPSGDQQTLAAAAYGFQISYPEGFSVFDTAAEQLAQLSPTPLAGWRVLNPQTAASDVAALEPADLEIRVYTADSAGLENWLVANTLLPADGSVTPASFTAANVTGLEVCSATMLAPGCGYFFASGDYFYQLIPASLEGEAMMRSFRVAE